MVYDRASNYFPPTPVFGVDRIVVRLLATVTREFKSSYSCAAADETTVDRLIVCSS